MLLRAVRGAGLMMGGGGEGRWGRAMVKEGGVGVGLDMGVGLRRGARDRGVDVVLGFEGCAWGVLH